MFQQSEIDALPIGLIVRHTPPQVQASRGGVDGQAFRWEYRTGVSAVADCVILGFAAYRWDGSAWVPRHPDGVFFTAGDFAEWYGTPDGRIISGGGWADPSNFCTAPELVAGRTKWVFVAQQASGRCVKGEAIVELLPELEPRALASSDPVEQFHANAEHFRKQMVQYADVMFDYDEASIQRLNDYIASNRDKLLGNKGWFELAGSFFGECLRRIFGGQWEANAGEGDAWGVRIDEKLVVFPFIKLHKHITDEGDRGESITGMLAMIRPMMAVNADKVRHFQYVDGKMVPVGGTPPEASPAKAPPPPPAASSPKQSPPPQPPGAGRSWLPWRRK